MTCSYIKPEIFAIDVIHCLLHPVKKSQMIKITNFQEREGEGDKATATACPYVL